jgi:hypothetical protein
VADRTVSVALVAKISGYKGPIEDAAKATRKLDDDVDKLGNKTERVGTGFAAAGQKASRLDTQISDLRRSIKGLNAVYDAGGDPKILQQIEAELKAVTRLEGIKRRSAKEDNDRAKLAEKTAKAAVAAGLKVGEGVAEGAAIGIKAGSGAVADSIAGMAKNPYVLAGGVALGAGIAAVVAPAVGAALTGGLLAGTAFAAVGGGIVLALRDERVMRAGQQLGSDIGEDLTRGGRAFVGPTLDGIEQVRAGWHQIGPDVDKTLSAAAKYVEPLTDAFVGLVERAVPGFRHAVEAAGPVIEAFSRGIKGSGDEIGDFFDMMAEHADEGAAGIDAAFMVINTTAAAATWTLGALSDGFESVTSAGAKMSGMAEDAFAWVPVLGDRFKVVNDIWEDLNNTANGKELASAATYFGPLAAGAGSVASSYQAMSREQIFLTGSMQAGITAAGSLMQAFDALSGKAITSIEAEIAYQAAVDAATAAVAQNGRTLDLNTEKGRANEQTLLALAASSKAKAQATYDETLATGGSAAAQQRALAVYQQGREALMAAARAMGASADQARALADAIYGIPPSWQRTYTSVFTSVYKNVGTPSERRLTGSSRGTAYEADGGVIEAYAAGGMRERHIAQMARAGANRLWAEPETGGESYIPHAPSKRAGAVDVLQRTNAILGNPLGSRTQGGEIRVTLIGGDPATQALMGLMRVEISGSYGGSVQAALGKGG